jgi:hypothetical protein
MLEAASGGMAMKRRPTPDMAALFAEGTQMDRAVARAVKKAVEPHIRAGTESL